MRLDDEAPTPDELAQADTAVVTPIAERLRKGDVKARLFGAPIESARIGRYAVLRRLGAGGMGVVYSAYDDELDRKVAIKLVRGELAGPATIERVRREAQALARLSHPNVVQVYEVGTFRDQAYVAMEFVPGATLRAYQSAPGRTPREVLAAYLQAGRGLAAAHAVGLVHRDFKPDNALVGDDGRVRVVDFGLARLSGSSGQDPEDMPASPGLAGQAVGALTASGAVVGTPAYMAPEQIDGQVADARSDLFGFCVALYEALYGRRPYAGERPIDIRREIAAGQVSEPALAPDLPAAVRRALVRGLAEDPAARWPDMDALLAALARDPGRRLRRVAMAVLAALSVGTGVYALLARGESARAEEVAEAGRRAQAAETAAAAAAADAARVERVGLARRLATQAALEGDRDARSALLLAVEAAQATRRAGEPVVVEAEQALRDALAGPRSRPLAAPGAAAAARVALSADGRWAATRDAAGVLRLWDVAGEPRLVALDMAEQTEPEGPEQLALSFTPDGAALLAARAAGGAWRIDLAAPGSPPRPIETGVAARELVPAGEGRRALAIGEAGAALVDPSGAAPARVLGGLSGPVREASFSPDGRLALVVTADGAARTWSAQDGAPGRTLRGPTAVRRARAAWQPDGAAVLLTGPERTAQLVPVAGGPTRILRGHTDEVLAVAFAGDGSPLTLGLDDALRAWDPAGGSTRVELVRHAEAIGGAQFLPGGDLVLGTPYGGALWLWAVDERGEPLVLRGHASSVSAVRVSADGARLLTAAHDDPTPRLWRLGDDPQVLRGHEGLIERLAWRADGSRLVSAASDGTARVWPLDGSPPQVLRRHREDSAVVAALRPDGRVVATAGSDGVARLWRVDGPEPALLGGPLEHVSKDMDAPGLRDVAWSPDGDVLAVAGEDGAVRLWAIDPAGARSLVSKVSLGTGPIELVRFTPDGARLVCAGADGDARLVPLQGPLPGTPVVFGGHAAAIRSIALAEYGRVLATASDDGTARVFDLTAATPRLIRELAGHARGLWSVDLAAPRAVTASADGTARVWVVDDAARPPATLLGHGQAVLSATFSPDGSQVLTTSADGTARIWREDPGAEDRSGWTSVALPHAGSGRPGELDRNVWIGAWRPGGAQVATASADGVIRLFPADVEPLIAEACARAGGELPPAVWTRVFGDRPRAPTCP